jgi:hypothetical protein
MGLNKNQELIKSVGVMMWLINALDEITTDPNLRYIVKHDLKQQLKRTNKKLEEQLNILFKGADIEVHEQAQGIYNLIDEILLIEE